MKKPTLICLFFLTVCTGFAQKNYSLLDFANYHPEDDLCTGLGKLKNDAPNNFASIRDTSRHTDDPGGGGGRNYECSVRIKGTKKVYLHSSFGVTAMMDYGTFKTPGEVSEAGK